MVRKGRNNNPNNRLLYDPNQREQRRLGAFSMGENIDEDEMLDENIEEETTDTPQDNTLENQENVGQETGRSTGTSAGSAIKEGAKELGKQVGKKAMAVAGKVAAKIVAVIAANPWILAVLAGVIIIFLIILMLAGDSKQVGYYDGQCNYNITRAIVDDGTGASTSMGIDEFVIRKAYSLTKDGTYSDDTKRALMIVIKTNALSDGKYNSSDKVVYLDETSEDFHSISKTDAEYTELQQLYKGIEDYLYLSSSYNDVINSLSSRNSLPLDQDILDKMEIASETNAFANILNEVYNDSSDEEENASNVVYNDSIFIGDSRMKGILLYTNLINENNTVYGVGYGYNWFIGNGSFSSTYTNSVSGGILGANSKMSDNKNYNIIIALGINDFGYISAETYVNKYIELAQGEWKDHMIYIVENGPVDESKTSIRNADIDAFNDGLASLINSSGVNNLNYIDINYNITSYDSMGVHYGKEDCENIYNDIVSQLGTVSGKYSLYDLGDYCEYIVTETTTNSSMCSTSSDSANILTFIKNFEGSHGTCDSNNYRVKDTNDGAYTVGYGITNADIGSSATSSYIDENGWGKYFHSNNGRYYMSAGDCIPIAVIDKITIFSIEANYAAPIDNIAQELGLTLTQYQKDAITSFNYNLGSGYTRDLLEAYKNGSYEGLWNEMKSYVNATINGVYGPLAGLKKRRKAEFALFVTGDYTDQGIFLSRNLDNYDYYDSEGVMSRQAICQAIAGSEGLITDTDTGFVMRTGRPERTNSFYYNQADSNQLAYTDYEGECSWYAGHRAKEILSSINSSKTWSSMPDGGQYCYTSEVSSGQFRISKNVFEPKAGALISMYSSSSYGHVAVVEKVNPDGSFVISEGYITLGAVSSRSELESWYSKYGRRMARKINCESNNSGCFTTRTIYPANIKNSFICYIYLVD